MAARRCRAVNASGEPCGARPLHESSFCFVHDPAQAEAAAEARRLGGLRRRREGTLTTAFDLGDLRTLEGQWRLLEVAVTDIIALDNGIARGRLLVNAVNAAAKLRDATEVDARIAALNAIGRDPGTRR